MLEDECCLLDAEVAHCIGGTDEILKNENLSKIRKYIKEKRKLEESITNQEEMIELIQDSVRREIVKNPSNEEQIRKIYSTREEYFQNKKNEKVKTF